MSNWRRKGMWRVRGTPAQQPRGERADQSRGALGWEEHPAKQRQKDVARWTKKNKENHYGYKNHINADEGHKLIQDYEVTDAAVHDSQVFETLVDHTPEDEGTKRTAYADSVYRSQEREQQLAEAGIESQI